MTKRDLILRYAGSWLGFFWAIINPIVMIGIYWFVFGFGLKVRTVSDAPFIVWLMAGMAIWLSFAEIIMESTIAITNNSHLIKKISFPSEILPIVKLLSATFSHSIFLILLCILLAIHGYRPAFHFIQFFYYYTAMSFLALGISWHTAAFHVFARDVSQLVQVILQILFWFTPIIWDLSIMPESIASLLRWNPIFYLVQGYRDSFISYTPFWSNWIGACCYWIFSLLVLYSGVRFFYRLQPHFDDSL